MDIFSETPTETKFEDLVGDGKKYATPDAAAKAIADKDAFIARLIEEKRRLEADHQAALNTKAFEDRLMALEAAKMTEPPVTTPTPVSQPQTTPVDIEATVQAAIEAREKANARTRNLINVKDKLTEVFGADYPNRVKAKAAELGLEVSRLNEMAAETPQAFFALIGLTGQRQPDNPAPPRTSQNTAAAFAPQVSKKNNAYYADMRRTDPNRYWSRQIQMEEWNEAKRQGEAFYS